MEFEYVSEEVEWEAQRVAAAFGLVRWTEGKSGTDEYWKRAYLATGQCVEVNFEGDNPTWRRIAVGEFSQATQEFEDTCHVFPDLIVPACSPFYNQLMARALYRLGFEEEAVLRELNHPLSSHEKLELRLSMPREFWPKTWLEDYSE